MAGHAQTAADLGSLAGRASALGADFQQMKGRLNLRHTAMAATYNAAGAAMNVFVHLVRLLEVSEQGGVTAPKEASRG